MGAFRSSREEAYRKIVAEAERLRRKAELGGSWEAPMERLGRLERGFRAERRRDYFRSPLRKEAAEALRAARRAVRGQAAGAQEGTAATTDRGDLGDAGGGG